MRLIKDPRFLKDTGEEAPVGIRHEGEGMLKVVRQGLLLEDGQGRNDPENFDRHDVTA